MRKALHFRTKEIRAIKIIDKAEIGKENWKMIVREIDILRKIDHPNIVKIFEFFESMTHFYIVMEFCHGKLLFQKFDEKKRTDEKEAARIMLQVLEALHYLHQREIVHMDLKSENIIYNGRTVKLIDFGLSQHFNPNKRMKKIQGTKYYLAPEVITKKYNHKCDIWSAGVLLFMLLTGKTPFRGDSENELFDNILKNRYANRLEDFSRISKPAKELIRLMLTPDMKARPEAEELIKHGWLVDAFPENIQDKEKVTALIANIKSFQFHNKLQRGIFYYFINNLITNEEHEKMSKAFKLLDADHDGELSMEEFIRGMKRLDSGLSEQQIKEKFLLIDTDLSGSISYMEFVAGAFTKEEFLNGQRLYRLFKVIDLDDNNKISVEEFMVLFGKSQYITVEELKEIIKETDLDDDGEINFEEFKHFMRQVMTDFEFSSKKVNYEEMVIGRSRVHSMFASNIITDKKFKNAKDQQKSARKKQGRKSRMQNKRDYPSEKRKRKYSSQNSEEPNRMRKKRTLDKRKSVQTYRKK